MGILSSIYDASSFIVSTKEILQNAVHELKTAEIILRMNSYLVMGLSIYSTYRFVRKLIYTPLMATIRYLIN